jgi:TadE-like protein
MSCSNSPRKASILKPQNRRLRERGSAMIEFVMCVGLFWAPLFFGATQFGFHLIQALQVTQVCRDAGHMFAYGIDFSQTSNQYLLASFAPALNVDPTGAGGSSVVILSTVNYIGLADCQAGGYGSTCPNYGQLVFTSQTVIGNPSLHASAFGTPVTSATTGLVQPGSPSTAGYLNAASALVVGFPNISLATGTTGQQYAYIAEMFSKSSTMNWFLPSAVWVDSQNFF